jgi:uncharacterized membrane protein
VVAIALSLAASLSWGLADFAAGVKSRQLGVLTTLLWVQGGGILTVLTVIVASGEPLPDGRTVLFAALAGIVGQSALGMFYRALAVGSMSIVAPISATGVTLPVVVGLATGDRVGTLVGLGLLVTFAGVVLASREEALEEERAKGSRAAIVLALVAAAGFGCYFVFADVAADGSIMWLLAIGRLVSSPVVALLAWRRRAPLIPARRDALQLLLVAQFDLGATALYGVATTKGALSVVAVIGSLYPVATVLLARLVLHERITRTQAAGVAGALTGVALVTLG